MTPNDPVFEEGETIVLNCTLTDQFNGTENSSLLGFKHGGIVYGSEFVHHLTPETAQLQISNATLDLFGTYVCILLPNISLGLAQQFVAVVSKLLTSLRHYYVLRMFLQVSLLQPVYLHFDDFLLMEF